MSKERLTHPLDTAVWWVESILSRGKLNNHDRQKNLGLTLNWIQRRGLDSWIFILLLGFAIFAGIALFIAFTIHKLINAVSMELNDSRRSLIPTKDKN
jgi:hypothetical protein